MEYVAAFGKREYIFYRENDVQNAVLLWERTNKDNEDFERSLEGESIDFTYNLELFD